jgi:hypothetical protein
MGGKFHLKLNIGTRPIANKYCEGKVKRTLKRELKERESVLKEAIGVSSVRVIISDQPRTKEIARLFRTGWGRSLLIFASQPRFKGKQRRGEKVAVSAVLQLALCSSLGTVARQNYRNLKTCEHLVRLHAVWWGSKCVVR